MKKIKFNDKCGLTEAVLEGRKTQIRRPTKSPKKFGKISVSDHVIARDMFGEYYSYLVDGRGHEIEGSFLKPFYSIGEEVAVAQSQKGIKNRRVVKADMLPHRIRITGIRIEHLHDISEDDCIKEGVDPETPDALLAFSRIVNKTYGKDTWDSNPYVFAYDFELIK